MTARTRILSARAREILDSRGRPTVEVDVVLEGGASGRGVAPSGASTGATEAHELRDADPKWYGGCGVRRAVGNVNGEIDAAIRGCDAEDQLALDQRLVELDGTSQLKRLGANAILPVSMAAFRAVAAATAEPLHARIARFTGSQPSLPMPMVNILSGGLHANGGMDVQDFLAIPVGAHDFTSALHMVASVRQAAAEITAARGLTTLLADEGGLSPGFGDTRAALDLMIEAIERAGLEPGKDVQIALDIAASSLIEEGSYRFRRSASAYSSDQMIELVAGWTEDYPIRSIEDALGDEDWDSWTRLTQRLKTLQIVGDDLFTTNPQRIQHGIACGAANAVLIKINQNGTLSGTFQALRIAREAQYATVVSARSGETEDDFIAHLATGAGAGQIKIGSLRSSERLAKYNTLLRIADLYPLTFSRVTGLSGNGYGR